MACFLVSYIKVVSFSHLNDTDRHVTETTLKSTKTTNKISARHWLCYIIKLQSALTLSLLYILHPILLLPSLPLTSSTSLFYFLDFCVENHWWDLHSNLLAFFFTGLYSMQNLALLIWNSVCLIQKPALNRTFYNKSARFVTIDP